jgi:hypothetical protein
MFHFNFLVRDGFAADVSCHVEALQSIAPSEEVLGLRCAFLSFARDALSSGRMAGILRSVAAGGFRHGLQHDCHEALTYILSIAHEEETALLKLRQQDSISEASNSQEHLGIIAKNFGIMERVVLKVLRQFCHRVGFSQVFSTQSFPNTFAVPQLL